MIEHGWYTPQNGTDEAHNLIVVRVARAVSFSYEVT